VRFDRFSQPSVVAAPRVLQHCGTAVAPKKKSSRLLRRARAREQEKLVRDLERLARLEPGGSPERPLVIDTPAVVEVRAEAKPCPLCGGSLKLKEHAAENIDGARLRVARVACTMCGVKREIYFRLDEPMLH
jgi:hypothetical protein